MIHRTCRLGLLAAFLLCAVPVVAQDPVFWTVSSGVIRRMDQIGASPLRWARTFDRGLVPSEVLHVADSGNDSGNGSPGSPFATIGRAVLDAGPGTAIRLHAGTYAGGNYYLGSYRRVLGADLDRRRARRDPAADRRRQ